MKDLLVYAKKIQGILFKRGKNGNSQRGGMLNIKKGSKAETIVIPDESACSGRDPVSRNEWFCWIPDSRYAPSGMTGLVLPL
jgi:hypothetical protein